MPLVYPSVLCFFQFLLHPFGLAVFEDFIYWSDLRSKTLNRCDKFKCTNQTFIAQRFKHPLAVAVAHPVVQPAGQSVTLHCHSVSWLCFANFTCMQL